jgi:serine/threonine protein phosphatase PrpC
MTYLLASAARATVGARSGQEDAFSVWPAEGQLKPSGDSGMLAVLADGMGGHRGGAVAGQTACSTFTEAFSHAQMPIGQRLEMALHASNDAIADAVDKNSGLKGMGCTLIGAWFDDEGMRWTSVGDSLLLLYRFPDVIRLNEDHSLGSYLDEQARRNEISVEEARGNRHRNALRSALTGSQIDLVDLRGEPLQVVAGDWILLASDGIASLEGDELADIMFRNRDGSPDDMAQALIAAVDAKRLPEQDNTTVVAVRVEGASETVVMRPGSSGPEDVTLRTKRIGVVSRRKDAQTATRKPSTFETLIVKGPMALLLAAAAAFVLAAAIYLYNASNGLSALKPSPGKDIPVDRRDPGNQKPPVQPSPASTPAPEPATPTPVPGSGSSPGTRPAPPSSVPTAPPAQPPAATPETVPPRPVPAQPPARAVPPTGDAPVLRSPSGSGARRPAPRTTTEDPDTTLQPGASGDLSPGGSDSLPQSQQGSSGFVPSGPRKPDKVISAPLSTKDEAKQGSQRR